MPEPELIKCPSCEGIDFDVRLITNLIMASATAEIESYNIRKAFVCPSCGYTIGGLEDLDMSTIYVYLIGDSLSGRRQGMNKIEAKTGIAIDPDKHAGRLAVVGYFKLADDAYVFTKSAWKRSDADPEFRLTDGQYAVQIEEMF